MIKIATNKYFSCDCYGPGVSYHTDLYIQSQVLKQLYKNKYSGVSSVEKRFVDKLKKNMAMRKNLKAVFDKMSKYQVLTPFYLSKAYPNLHDMASVMSSSVMPNRWKI